MVDQADSLTGSIPSLPEDVQMVLATGGGELADGGMEAAAAALVELTLLGRLGSVPEKGFLARKEARKLVVLDDRPTGVPTLDSALEPMVRRGRPWYPFYCIRKLCGPVSRATQDVLIERGAIRREGRAGGLKTTLWIADEPQHRASVHRLDTAWLNPGAVTDPRSGAFVDLLRNAGERFSRGAGRDPVIAWEWYPEEVRDTVAAILDAERTTTSASSGTGYEG